MFSSKNNREIEKNMEKLSIDIQYNTFEKLLKQQTEEFKKSPDDFYYILSLKWLNSWKKKP